MNTSHELTAPIAWKDAEKRIVYGPVLVPDEPDSDGDVVKAEKIEEVAHTFMEKYGGIDLMHGMEVVGKVLESYIAPQDLNINGYRIPKASWMMGVRVTDEDVWNAVKSGVLSGFSIMAIPTHGTKAVKNQAASKRVTLADLGEWDVNYVSLVDEPAVPQAKWVAIKSHESFKDKFLSVFQVNKEGRVLSSANYEKLRNAYEALEAILNMVNAEKKEEGEMTDEQFKELMSKVDGLDERLAKLETPEAGSNPAGENTTENTDTNTENTDSTTENSEGVTEEAVAELVASEVGKMEERIVGSLDKALKNRRLSIKGLSDRITGQDGHEDNSQKMTERDRDIFGRRIKQ